MLLICSYLEKLQGGTFYPLELSQGGTFYPLVQNSFTML
jgi:hypothetical protein